MDYHALSEEVKQYALSFFNSQHNDQLQYHNFAHTEGVIKAATQLGNHYQLNDEDFFIVITAVWFHDMGYYAEDMRHHEQKGADKAAAFLKEKGVTDGVIEKVKGCILATTLPQRPTNLLEQIICDADLFHLGTDDFAERNKLIRKEFSSVCNKDISKEEWRKGTILLLSNHTYHTDYAKELLDKKKQENLDKLIQKQKEVMETNDSGSATVTSTIPNAAVPMPVVVVEDKEKKKKKKNKDSDRPDKGIETMFRVASTNHQRLSDLSDNKAHIMISVNSIIISVIIGLVVRKMDASQNIIIPTLILLTGSVIAVVFSVLATRPKLPDGTFTSEQVDNKTANLLFFGNFYKMDYDHYYEGMKKVMADREFLYGSLIRDIHSQGIVLGHKYKLLRVSYTIFMWTLILSILAFAVAMIFFK